MTDQSGQVTAQYAFITNHQITHENVEELIQAGRCRWKIENENNKYLEDQRVPLRAQLRARKKHLSATLLTLNLLAFLFHMVLQLTDIQCAQLRQALPRRDTFFQHIGTLTQYLCFASRLSISNLWVEMTQLDAGISGGKAPLHWLAGPIALFHPGAYFVAQRVDVRYPTSQTLPCQHAELAFSDVQPTAVFRRIHELQLGRNARALAGSKVLYSDAPVCVLRLSISSVIRCACG